MNKLNKKIGALALVGALFVGGFAVTGVQAYAQDYEVDYYYEETTSRHLNPHIDTIDRILEKLGGSHRLYEVYSSEDAIRQQLDVGVASRFGRVLRYIPGANDEARLERYLNRFLFRDGFDAFGIKFDGMYYLFIRK